MYWLSVVEANVVSKYVEKAPRLQPCARILNYNA